MVLRLLLLRPDQQEIEDDENQDQRQELHQALWSQTARRLRVGRAKSASASTSKWCAAPSRGQAIAASRGKARTIAARRIGTRLPAKGQCRTQARALSGRARRCDSVRASAASAAGRHDGHAETATSMPLAAPHRRRARTARAAGAAGQRSRRRRRLCLARRPRMAGAGAERQPGRDRPAARASTGCATSCSTTPSASPPGCRPTTCCCGARAAPARASLVKAAHAAVNEAAEPRRRWR